MQLTLNFTPGYIEVALIVLLFAAILVFQLYRRFPIHLIYRSKIGFESMLDAINEPLAVISKDYCVRRVNKAYIALTGRSYRVCINARCYYLLRGRTSPCEDCKLTEAMDTSASVHVESSPHPTSKNGSVNITFSPYAMPIKGNTAELCGIEHIRDITALEKMKINLERRNNFLVSLTNKLRAARRSIKSELHIARQIQRGLMPTEIPTFDNIKIDVVYKPINDVGGDLYDLIQLDGNRLGLFVGDAAGHGLASSLIGTLSKMSLYNHSKSNLTTVQLLDNMNKDLIAHIHSSHYLTCVWCIFDFDKNVVSYSRAGHPLQIILRKDGTAENMGGDGVFLGIVEEAAFEQKELPFSKGDRFFFFTDGIFDIYTKDMLGKAGKFLGFDGFSEMVKTTVGKPFEEVLPGLSNKLSQFIHEDDYTLIVAEIT